MLFWKKRDPNKFISKRFHKVVNRAVNYLEKSPHYLLKDVHGIEGNGVYAIFYHGASNDFYDLLQKKYGLFNKPVYVGKAVPSGWRSRRTKTNDDSFNLEKRIKEHLSSLNIVQNLNVDDFSCQYVVLDPGLIASVEAEAIRRYEPFWNTVVEGFGNHNVGKNRLNQIRSDWDTLHPGRTWALKQSGPTAKEVRQKVTQHVKEKNRRFSCGGI